MQSYILDGSRMLTREDAHAEIARAMDFAPYYGGNLDALWDMISCMSGEVTLRNAAAMLNALQKYGCSLLKVFYDAAAENADLTLRLE